MTNVAEDPGNLNINTAYTWTPTGLLHTVQQGTQNRTFNYDAAGRLSSATQPESGTVSYTYDNVGNLMTVTDARGIVKSLYYDYLNRLNFIYYSSSGTTVGIGYDNGASGANTNNTRGRMTVIGNSYSSTHYTSYDAVGNVLASYQQTGGGKNRQAKSQFVGIFWVRRKRLHCERHEFGIAWAETMPYPGSPGCGHDANCMMLTHQGEIDQLAANNNVLSCPNPKVFLPVGSPTPASFTLRGGTGGVTGSPWGAGGFWDVVVGYACVTAAGSTTCETNYTFVRTQ